MSIGIPPVLKEKSFAVITGKVLAIQTRERSHVTGSGGDGRIHRGSGYINEINISTQHEIVKEIWGRTHEGGEWRVVIHGIDAPIREEHRIGILTFHGNCWAIRNYTLNDFTWLVRPETLATRPTLFSVSYIFTTIPFTLTFLFIINILLFYERTKDSFSSGALGWWFGIIPACICLLRNRSKKSAYEKSKIVYSKQMDQGRIILMSTPYEPSPQSN